MFGRQVEVHNYNSRAQLELFHCLSLRHTVSGSEFNITKFIMIAHPAKSMDINTMANGNDAQSPLLALPAEIRMNIMEQVFETTSMLNGLVQDPSSRASLGRVSVLDESYIASEQLSPLLVCRQLYQDSSAIGFSSTTFVMNSLFGDVAQRLSTIRPCSLEIIRYFTFVADARQFRKLVDWRLDAFHTPALNLDTLTIVLHRSSFWHYLFDYTEGIVKLLRTLRNVKRLVIVRNNARVKGSFKTWYNRLTGLIMKVDHTERYDKSPPCPESVWWSWSFDEIAQAITLDAQPPKEDMTEQAYMEMIVPLMQTLSTSIENEEYNLDPRSRYMYY